LRTRRTALEQSARHVLPLCDSKEIRQFEYGACTPRRVLHVTSLPVAPALPDIRRPTRSGARAQLPSRPDVYAEMCANKEHFPNIARGCFANPVGRRRSNETRTTCFLHRRVARLRGRPTAVPPVRSAAVSGERETMNLRVRTSLRARASCRRGNPRPTHPSFRRAPPTKQGSERGRRRGSGGVGKSTILEALDGNARRAPRPTKGELCEYGAA
jgi:hypothetical protein